MRSLSALSAANPLAACTGDTQERKGQRTCVPEGGQGRLEAATFAVWAFHPKLAIPYLPSPEC